MVARRGQNRSDLTPQQFATLIGKSRLYVIEQIRIGTIKARDERSRRSTLPRFRIDPAEVEAWKMRTEFVPSGDGELDRKVRSLPRLAVNRDRRIAAIREKWQREGVLD
jgi:hypothetical protein